MTTPGNPLQAEPPVYRLRAMSAHVLEMVGAWPARRHVRHRWWGNPRGQHVDTSDGRALLAMRDNPTVG
ncbi:MAG TPA: hypothetical protein VGF29_19055 [Hyphomicrobiaceae bacterium]|jgi:hypothetical protein